MNDNNFMRAMKFVAKWEGFYSDDKVDPGGKTKFGISDAGDGSIDGLVDVDRDGDGDVKVEELTWEQALQIYWKSYWLASGCDKLDLPLAVSVFDAAVNCGVGRATRWADRATDPVTVILRRRQFYNSLIDKNPALKKFYNGWINRTNDLRKYCELLAKEVVPEATYVTKLESKESNKT